MSGVPPTNQTFVGPLVVPVLPNRGRLRSRSTTAVPRMITPSMICTIWKAAMGSSNCLVRPGRTPVEVDEAFVAEPRPLPNAEGSIELDCRRRKAVLERRHIDDRLERRSGLAERLRGPVIAGSDDVEAALHGEHAPGVHLLRQHPARNLRHRAKLVRARAGLLDDDDHARLQ